MPYDVLANTTNLTSLSGMSAKLDQPEPLSARLEKLGKIAPAAADYDAEVDDEELASVTARAAGDEDTHDAARQLHGNTASTVWRTPNVATAKADRVGLPSAAMKGGTGKKGHADQHTAMLRRTPGANLMHRSAYSRPATHALSADGPIKQTQTPIASNHKRALSLESLLEANTVHDHNTALAAPPAATQPPSTNASIHTETPKPARPAPLNTSIQASDHPYARRTNLYTPAGVSLAKNQELHLPLSLTGTFSPHTIRLTEALDHLLQEDDDDDDDHHHQQHPKEEQELNQILEDDEDEQKGKEEEGDDEDEAILPKSVATHSHAPDHTCNSDMSEKQDTGHDLYSTDSFAESLIGVDMIVVPDDWDTDTNKLLDRDFYLSGAVNDEAEEYEDDYTSSVGSFRLDSNHSYSSIGHHTHLRRQHNQQQQQIQQNVTTQTLYTSGAAQLQTQSQTNKNPLLNTSRTGTYLMISSDTNPKDNHHVATHSLHRHTNSGGSSSIGSAANSGFYVSDHNPNSQVIHALPTHRHTNSLGSSSFGSAYAASTITSTITTNSKMASREDNHSAQGKTLKPKALLGSSFQRFTRTPSFSSAGSTGDGAHSLHAISDDASLPRSIRSSEGGAFVPTSKQVMNSIPTISIPGSSASSICGKPPVPDRQYAMGLNQSATSTSLLQTATTSRNRIQGTEATTATSCADKGQSKVHPIKYDGQRTMQGHSQQRGVTMTVHHQNHLYSNNDVTFYQPHVHYPTVSPMPTVDEHYYYPNPMIHPLPGGQSPPLVAPYYPYNYELTQNPMGLLHHPPYSPETVAPTIMSPLTVPSIYPYPNVAGYYHPCASPVPFTTQPAIGPQATSAMGWSSDMNPNSMPWQPMMIRETTPSPCFPYVDFHSSNPTGVISPTPPITVGSPFPPSWMAVDPYQEYDVQNNMMYVPTNSYNHIFPSHHQPLYNDSKMCNGGRKLWTERKDVLTERGVYPEHNKMLQMKTDEGTSHYDLYKLEGGSRFSQKDSMSKVKDFVDRKQYPTQSKSIVNRTVPQPRRDMVSNDLFVHPSQTMSSSVPRPSSNIQSKVTTSKHVDKDWSVAVIELSHSRFKPSASVLCEPQESDFGDGASNRAALKNFYYTFRIKEKESIDSALQFADLSIESKAVPEHLYWRVYLELADLNKRKGNTKQARSFFKKACLSSPQSPEVWLEYTKFEEERGHMSKCSQLLYEGLDACDFNEALLIRAVKFEEKLSMDDGNRDLTRARNLLSRLKNLSLEKSWRALLEGAMLESRAGNLDTARDVFNFLVHHIPWYGPLYVEFHALERDLGRLHDALCIVERGLKENSRYGPLWFEAFKLCENLDMQENNLQLPRTMHMIDRACESISKELLWKVYLEAALAQERAAAVSDKDQMSELMTKSRKSFARTVLASPENMRWKVWLAAARMELSVGDLDTARRLCLMSNSIVPSKGRATVIIELARLEDYAGKIDLARALLCKAREEFSSEWKVWLESVNLESRNGKRVRAVKFCIEAIRLHSGTGRLWSALSQLLQQDGEHVYLSALKTAVTAVPKSGEVWCEVARMFLNPLCPTFDPKSARKYLNYGIKFTPQYGDSFLETLRLDLLEFYVEPIARHLGDALCLKLREGGHEDGRQIFFSMVKTFIQNAVHTISLDCMEQSDVDKYLIKAVSSLKNLSTPISITSDIELRCRNADPNYGLMWFYCRDSPIDSARTILNRTKRLLREELVTFFHVYITAWLRRIAVETVYGRDGRQVGGDLDEKSLESSLRSAATVEDLLQADDNSTIGAKFSVSDFSTGLVQLQRLSITNRKKCLFGVDSLLAQ